MKQVINVIKLFFRVRLPGNQQKLQCHSYNLGLLCLIAIRFVIVFIALGFNSQVAYSLPQPSARACWGF